MAELTSFNDSLPSGEYENKGLPGGLNVLTILTIIWCVITLLLSVWSFSRAKSTYDNKDRALEQMQNPNMPKWAKSLMPDPEHFDDMVTKSYNNRVPILLTGLIATGLCLVGALQMRKRKKQGYILYVTGELLPFLSAVFFIGTYTLTGIYGIIGIVFALLFILLYTVQRKHLIY